MDDTSLCCAFSGDREGVDELRTTLSGQLKITNDARRALAGRNDIDDDDDGEEEDDEEEDDFSEEDLLAQMGYTKSDPITEEDEDEKEDSYQRNEPPKHEPINPPIAELNLVSAFKGSREREEGRDKACRVSWAPDVYDPPCTSDNHFTESKSEQKGKGVSGKKRGGGKRSSGGGSSRGNEGGSKAGGGGKDKKKGEKKHKKRGDSGSNSW